MPVTLDDPPANMFADDTNLATRNPKELEKSSNRNIESVHKWILSNKFVVSEDKTGYMIIGS